MCMDNILYHTPCGMWPAVDTVRTDSPIYCVQLSLYTSTFSHYLGHTTKYNEKNPDAFFSIEKL